MPPVARRSVPLLALTLSLGAAALGGCQDEADDPQFTRVPVSMYDPAPGPPYVPPRPDGGRDAGDAGGDGGVGDFALDAAGDFALDAAVDAEVDAAGDPICQDDRDCVLAVRLTACDPCPVSVHVDTLLAERCVVAYIEGAALGAYAPADCWAECGEAIGEACFELPAAAVCDPPRQAGYCALFR